MKQEKREEFQKASMVFKQAKVGSNPTMLFFPMPEAPFLLISFLGEC